MSLVCLSEGWMRFGAGRKWRIAGPGCLCEIDDPGNTPHYTNLSSTLTKIRRIKATYSGRVRFGLLDEKGTGLDILVANSLTESFGAVPSPLSTSELRSVFNSAIGINPGVKLDEVIR